MKSNQSVPYVLAVVVLGILAFFTIVSLSPASVCLEEDVVEKILTVNNKNAAIQLKSGKVVIIHAASLQIGDKVCIRYGRDKS